MTLFEFVMVLVSIFVALGMATLLTGVADIIRARKSIRHYWVHTLIVTMVFLALAQVWWESWGLNAAPEWSFVALLMMLGSPICLFLISHLLFPESVGGADLAEYYFEVSSVVWSLGAVATLIGTSFRPMAFGAPLFEVGNLASVPTLLICLVLAVSRNRRLHTLLVPALFPVIVLDIVLITRILS